MYYFFPSSLVVAYGKIILQIRDIYLWVIYKFNKYNNYYLNNYLCNGKKK